MQRMTITHRIVGRGYTLVMKGVQESILISTDDLLFFVHWSMQQRAERE